VCFQKQKIGQYNRSDLIIEIVPLTSLVAVAVRLMALTLILQVCQSTYLISTLYSRLTNGLTLDWTLAIILVGYVFIQVVIPLAFWYGAGWLARSLVGPYDCSLQLGTVSKNDLYQLAFIYLGTLTLTHSLPGFMEQLFTWLSHNKPVDAGNLAYYLSEFGLGVLLVLSNRLLLKLVPPNS